MVSTGLSQGWSLSLCQTTNAIILTEPMSLLQKVKSGMGKPGLTRYAQCLASTFSQSETAVEIYIIYNTALDVHESVNTVEITEQTDWQAKQL